MNKNARIKAVLPISLGLVFASLSILSHAELIINNQPSDIVLISATPTVTTNSSISRSSTPSTESAKKLMQVMRVEEQIHTLVNIKSMAGEMATRAGQNGGFRLPEVDESELSEEQRQIRRRIEQIMAQSGAVLGQSVQNSLSEEELTQAYITAVQTHYSQNEVDALIGFYDTPMGQNILDKQPMVTQDFLQAITPKISEQHQQGLDDLMELMQGIFQSQE